MNINHSELSAWRNAARPPELPAKPRTKAGREWVRLTEALREALAVLDTIARTNHELDGRIGQTEERLRAALAARDLTGDPHERKAAADLAAELERDLAELRKPRDFDRETDVAARVCRQRFRDVSEHVAGNAAELLNGELAVIAHAAHERLAAWLDAGPAEEVAAYRRAEALATRLLVALGKNGQDLPSYDLAPVTSEIERLRSRGVPLPLPRTFFTEDGRPREPEREAA